VAALLALLGIGIAVTRHHSAKPAAAASPSPSASATEGWTSYPPDELPPPQQQFARVVTVPRPVAAVTPVLLLDDEPGFLVDNGGTLRAFAAVGGTDQASVLLGWCPASRSFQDPSRRYRYDVAGMRTDPPRGTDASAGGGEVLPEFGVRPHPGDASRTDIGDLVGIEIGTPLPGPAAACPRGALVLPPLPPRAAALAGAARRFRRLAGRYVVRTESRAFCARPLPRLRCATGGWEVDGFTQLPPEDLASAYTYEGEFLVRTAPDVGDFDVVLLPGARLVSRTGVGVRAVTGTPVSTRTRNGAFLLRFRADAGNPSGPTREYVVRPDVELHLDRGYTGLGQPPGTLATLRNYVSQRTDGVLFWMILDARGRVMRVVSETAVTMRP
jgi:hypothetical protein